MYIDANYFILIDIAILIFLLINIIRGFKDGFLYQIVNLLGLIVAILIANFLAPVFADMFDLWPHSWYMINEEIFNLLVYDTINNLAWFILLVIILKLIFLLFRPIAKFIGSIPLIKQVNKTLGIFSGAVLGLIWLFIFYLIMASPIIVNNREVINNTLFKYYDLMTVQIIKQKDLSSNSIKDYLDNHTFSEENQAIIKDWLIEIGVDDLPIEEFTQGANNE